MRFGRICVQIVESSCNFKELARILSYWEAVMGLRVEFIIVFLKMIGSRAGGF